MKFIVVTRHNDGDKVLVNPDMICAVFRSCETQKSTIIQFPGEMDNNIEVKESPGAIANLIKEVKECMY